MENTEENCEMIGKYGRKVSWNVKWYGRKVGWIVKWYEKNGRKVSWIVKRFGK